MLLIYLISVIAAVGCFWPGQSGYIRLDSRGANRILRTTLLLALLLTFMQIASLQEWIPQTIPGALMSTIYGGASGLIFGMTVRLYRQKINTGEVLYTPRTFWSEYGLDAAALLLLLFGLYRTTLFSDQPFTPIRVSSGISLFAIGLYSWILRPVPELRRKGILFLDRVVPIAALLSARWEEEQTLVIEYQEAGEPIQSIHLHLPDMAERRDADRAITRLLEESGEIRKENEQTGISA